MLSLKRGMLIARTQDGQDIFIDTKASSQTVELPRSFWRKVDPDKMAILQNAITKRISPRDASLVEYYDEALSLLSKLSGRTLEFHDTLVYQMPMKKDMEHILLAAPSGAGKTYFACNWIKQFLKMNKNKEFFIISRHEVTEDKQVERLKPYRISLEEFDEGAEPIHMEDLENSVVMFDDIENIQNKKIVSKIQSLRNDIAENGRHNNIKLVSCIHVLLGGGQTKILLNEASSVVLFPKSGATHHITLFCKKYMGFNKDTIKKILDLPSRWVSISKRAPYHVIHERGVFLV